MTRIEFIKKYYSLVERLSAEYGIFPEIVFAQAMIESSNKKGFGMNYNAVHGNNYFGIRPGANWNGATLENPEVKSESKIFRAYDSVEDSIKDYYRFLASNSRYKKAGVFSAANWKQQAQALANAGYAGKGNESKYYDLITKVGTSVQKVFSDVLKKTVKVVSENKTSAGLILAGLLVTGILLYGRK